MVNETPLLSINHLQLSIRPNRSDAPISILRNVSFDIRQGESVGVVGESGSGKSMTTRAVMRLLPNGSSVSGSIGFDGQEVTTMSKRALSKFRSHDVGMIYQDPRAHINRLWTIGDFLIEGVTTTGQMTAAQAREKAIELLAEVGIPDGARRMQQYPHQLSGGLLQRVMIVAALMTEPKLIIADEATTALDVTVQADVMGVFADLREHHDASLLFITHDLDLATAVTDTIVVMYAGSVVERGSAAELYATPRHPYTAALLKSRPDPHSKKKLLSIPGRPMAAAEVGGGCAFAARCPWATELCRSEEPALRPFAGGMVACHRAEEIADQLTEAA